MDLPQTNRLITHDNDKRALFIGWDNVVIPGNDIIIPNIVKDENECAQNCMNTPNCYLYTYNKTNNTCNLKQLYQNNIDSFSKMLLNP